MGWPHVVMMGGGGLSPLLNKEACAFDQVICIVDLFSC